MGLHLSARSPRTGVLVYFCRKKLRKAKLAVDAGSGPAILQGGPYRLCWRKGCNKIMHRVLMALLCLVLSTQKIGLSFCMDFGQNHLFL